MFYLKNCAAVHFFNYSFSVMQFMTALSSEDQRKRGERLGADRYLVKSQVGIEDVINTIHEVLNDNPAPAPAQPASQAEYEQSPTPAQ